LKFIDEVSVHVAAGRGGNGAVSWRREKYIPRGGPDGGNGGSGGAVIFCADANINTLIDFSFRPHLTAKDAGPGTGKDCHGENGQDLIALVPVGTQVFYQGELIADLSVNGSRWIAAKGGRGGKGNAYFKSSKNRSPHLAQKGQTGETFEFRLILKSVADVGLVGFPNVGKSSLVGAISAARPRVADYPFTTLEPSLGVVFLSEGQSFVIADIPGIIEGAHDGKGLGIQFLKHIERTRVLAYVLDPSTNLDSEVDSAVTEAKRQYATLSDELCKFSPELLTRRSIVIISKGDIEISKDSYEDLNRHFATIGKKCFLTSSLVGEGLDELKRSIFELL